jgi:hypothetical protein
VIWNHDLRRASERGCGGRSRAAVVHDGSNLREQRMHVDLADRGASGSFSTSESSNQPCDTVARRPSARAAWSITGPASSNARVLPKPK